MAILKIRDANGNVQEILAIKGNDYVLTEKDKQEIASMIPGGGTVDLSKVLSFKKVTESEFNALEYTEDTLNSVLYLETDTGKPFFYALVFSFGNEIRGLMSQVAIGDNGLVYKRSESDNFAEWHEMFCSNSDLEAFKLSMRDTFEDYEEWCETKFMTEEQVLELIQNNMPSSGDEVSY